MAHLDRPFSSFVKQHRPVEAAISGYVKPLEDLLRSVESLAALNAVEAQIEQLLSDMETPTLALGGRRTASVRRGEWAPRADGIKVAVTRHHVAVQLIGDPMLCCAWPQNSDDLMPVDDEVWPESDLETVDDRDHVWALSAVNERGGEWALYTFLDLTVGDEARVAAGTLDVVGVIDERLARIEPIVERINRDLQEFFGRELRETLRNELARLREELSNRASVSEALKFPNEWVVEPIHVIDESISGANDSNSGHVASVNVVQVPRLEPASFQRLQRTIRLWADAIERTPGGFRDLKEDQISDLLAATLNATLAGAGREVFSRSGKTDIFVRADILNEGYGPSKVFVTESKKAISRSVVREAVEEQLFKYVTTSDLASVALLLFPQKDYLSVRGEYLAILRDIPGFLRERASSVDDWPIYSYEVGGRTLEVCVATVHL